MRDEMQQETRYAMQQPAQHRQVTPHGNRQETTGQYTLVWGINRRWFVLFCLLLGSVLSGCSDRKEVLVDDPEQQIRTLISSAIQAVETRDIEATMNFVSESYLDRQSQDKSRIRAMLGYIFRNQRTVHLSVRINQISFPTEQQASVILYAAMAATPIKGSDEFVLGRFHFYRFEMEFNKETDQWRLASARWRRATRSDLF